MTVRPLAPWVKWTRVALIVLGFGWVPCLFLWHRFVEHSDIIRPGLIVAFFLWAMVFPWLLLLSMLLPTHQSRIVGMPVAFLMFYVTAQSPPPFSSESPVSMPWLVLWLITCVAVTLLIPQFTTIAAFFIHIGQDVRKRWTRS